jgi:hypothetical protein
MDHYDSSQSGSSHLCSSSLQTSLPVLSPQNASCPILNLPNEILRHILTMYLVRPRYGSPLESNNESSYRYHAPAMTIRAVCRQFREVANELPFWYQDDFDLLDLLPRRQYPNVRSSSSEESFLKVVLADNHLVETLQRKTHWNFRSLGGFSAILECIPSFDRSTTSVKIYPFHQIVRRPVRTYPFYQQARRREGISPEPVFRKPANCRRLTSLEFGYSNLRGKLDLDVLSNSCPFLTTLVIHTDFTYVLSGTLAGLSNVHQFRLHPHGYSPGLMPLFPMSSANSLENLSLSISSESYFESLWPPSVINIFANLTSLRVEPLNSKICKFLTHSRLKLLNFTTTVEERPEITMENVAQTLSSECLQKVETLSLAVRSVDKHHVTTLQPMVDVITT